MGGGNSAAFGVWAPFGIYSLGHASSCVINLTNVSVGEEKLAPMLYKQHNAPKHFVVQLSAKEV